LQRNACVGFVDDSDYDGCRSGSKWTRPKSMRSVRIEVDPAEIDALMIRNG
jgi:hypothetical protein